MAISAGNYSASEFSSMQQDAVRRVREMQRRAQQQLDASNRTLPPSETPPKAEQKPRPQNSSPPKSHDAPSDIPRQIPTNTAPPSTPELPLPFGLDGETALLLILIYLLWRDGADRSLILALLYILIA